jgi:hypothetical protein
MAWFCANTNIVVKIEINFDFFMEAHKVKKELLSACQSLKIG